MIYIGTDGGIYRWTEGAPWPVFHALQGRRIVALAAPGGGMLAAGDDSGGVWESLNNGLDWRPAPFPAWNKPVGPLAVGGGDPPTFLVATEGSGLYRRAFGANGWDPVPSPTARTSGPAPKIRSLATGPTWFAAVAGEGLWRSADSGATWTRCEGLPAEVFAVRAPLKPAGIVLAGTSEGAWISRDGGNAWEKLGSGLEAVPHVSAIEISPEDPKFLLAGVAPSEPGAGAAAPRDGLAFALHESKDAGKTWARVRRGLPEDLMHDTIVDIRFDPHAPDYGMVALGSGELWRTRTGGDWWEPLARQIKGARVLAVA